MPKLVTRIQAITRNQALCGLLVLAFAALGLLLANLSAFSNPWLDFLSQKIHVSALGFSISISHLVSDGFLAVFFFVVAVELKEELTHGALRDLRTAALPMIVAVLGIILPVLFFLGLLSIKGLSAEFGSGWAIPSATDIAFALALLAVFGRSMPLVGRSFLLTLAVVDDLIAIVLIALFLTGNINFTALLISLAVIFALTVLRRKFEMPGWVLFLGAVVAWGFMYESGVHATIAAVLLGFTLPLKPGPTLAVFHPISALIALPVFALVAASVPVFGMQSSGEHSFPALVMIIAVAMLCGKFCAVVFGTRFLVRFTRLSMPVGMKSKDLVPLGFLAGIGFTVSLLIAELSFSDATVAGWAKVGVLVASLTAGVFASVALLAHRNGQPLRVEEVVDSEN